MDKNKQGCGKRKKKTAIAFDSWKRKHYFELIWFKSKNIEVNCTLGAECKTFSTCKISMSNLINLIADDPVSWCPGGTEGEE